MIKQLFSRVPMFIYGGLSAYTLQYICNNDFKSGFRAGLNQLFTDDITDEEYYHHYSNYNNRNSKSFLADFPFFP